jgi:hypothetical protein
MDVKITFLNGNIEEEVYLEQPKGFEVHNRASCNVPILGHYNFTECYAYQSSQIGVTESLGDIEGFYWARLASFITRIHSAQLGFSFVAFRRFP